MLHMLNDLDDCDDLGPRSEAEYAMISFRSGYKHCPRVRVEACLTLSAARLQTLGVLRPDFTGTRRVVWENQDGYNIAGGVWEIDVQTFPFNGRIAIVAPGEPHPLHSLSVSTTTLPRGGIRWWFECPLRCRRRGMIDCCKRVGKLYLPPRQYEFGCRECHELTYRSSQMSHGAFSPDETATQQMFLADDDSGR